MRWLLVFTIILLLSRCFKPVKIAGGMRYIAARVDLGEWHSAHLLLSHAILIDTVAYHSVYDTVHLRNLCAVFI